MFDYLKENTDKFLVIGVLAAFGYSAAHGGQYSQHVVDWALGGLGVLIVQRSAKSQLPN